MKIDYIRWTCHKGSILGVKAGSSQLPVGCFTSKLAVALTYSTSSWHLAIYTTALKNYQFSTCKILFLLNPNSELCLCKIGERKLEKLNVQIADDDRMASEPLSSQCHSLRISLKLDTEEHPWDEKRLNKFIIIHKRPPGPDRSPHWRHRDDGKLGFLCIIRSRETGVWGAETFIIEFPWRWKIEFLAFVFGSRYNRRKAGRSRTTPSHKLCSSLQRRRERVSNSAVDWNYIRFSAWNVTWRHFYDRNYFFTILLRWKFGKTFQI